MSGRRIARGGGGINALLLTNRVLLGLAVQIDSEIVLPTHEMYIARHTINVNSIAAVEKALSLPAIRV